MTHDEFADLMKPLQIRHEKNFTPYVQAAVYRIIGHLNAHQGRDIVGQLMLRSRMAPEEKDFRDAVNEIQRPKNFVKHEEHRYDQIFSDEERKEIWQFVKDAASGKRSNLEIENYTEMLNEAIRNYYKKRPHGSRRA